MQCCLSHLLIWLYVTMAIFQSHSSHWAQCVHVLSLQADPEGFLMCFILCFSSLSRTKDQSKQIVICLISSQPQVSEEKITLNHVFISKPYKWERRTISLSFFFFTPAASQRLVEPIRSSHLWKVTSTKQPQVCPEFCFSFWKADQLAALSCLRGLFAWHYCTCCTVQSMAKMWMSHAQITWRVINSD